VYRYSEGGHSKHRIVHAADMTGKEIERALLESARAHPNVTFYEHHMVRLYRCRIQLKP
jgi:L-aspartate oxidase